MVQMLSMVGFVALFASALITAPASTVHAQNQGAPFPSFNCDAPGENFQTHIDNAPYGATIFFGGNCDDGPYFINSGQNLHLRGFSSGGTLSASSGGFAVLAINFANVTISRLTIDATNADVGLSTHGSSVLIENTVVEGALTGLNISGSSSVDINGVVIRDNAHGMHVNLSSYARLIGVTIERSVETGVLVTGSSSAIIGLGTVIDDNGQGVASHTNSHVSMSDSTITNNVGDGVQAALDGFINFEDPPNTIEGNGSDVSCVQRGALRVVSPQTSATGTTNISADCLVDGTIF